MLPFMLESSFGHELIKAGFTGRIVLCATLKFEGYLVTIHACTHNLTVSVVQWSNNGREYLDRRAKMRLISFCVSLWEFSRLSVKHGEGNDESET